MTDQLQPIRPEDAVEMYLRERSTDASEATLDAHEYRLGHFIRWCNEKDINNLNALSGRDLHRYKLWRKEDGDLNQVSVKTQMDTLRVFTRFCESIDPHMLEIEHEYEDEVSGQTLQTERDHEIGAQYLTYHNSVIVRE